MYSLTRREGQAVDSSEALFRLYSADQLGQVFFFWSFTSQAVNVWNRNIQYSYNTLCIRVSISDSRISIPVN